MLKFDNVHVFFKGDDEPRAMKIEEVTDITADEDCPHRSFLTTREATFNVKIDPADLRKLDIMFRPYAIICNPKDEYLFVEYKKKGYVIYPTPTMEEGMCSIVDRRKTEEF